MFKKIASEDENATTQASYFSRGEDHTIAIHKTPKPFKFCKKEMEFHGAVLINLDKSLGDLRQEKLTKTVFNNFQNCFSFGWNINGRKYSPFPAPAEMKQILRFYIAEVAWLAMMDSYYVNQENSFLDEWLPEIQLNQCG